MHAIFVYIHILKPDTSRFKKSSHEDFTKSVTSYFGFSVLTVRSSGGLDIDAQKSIPTFLQYCHLIQEFITKAKIQFSIKIIISNLNKNTYMYWKINTYLFLIFSMCLIC